MAKLYNQKSVATNKATTAQTSTSFKYRGFSSNEIKNNFKLYDMELVKRDLLNHFYIRKGEKLENPNFVNSKNFRKKLYNEKSFTRMACYFWLRDEKQNRFCRFY